MRYNFSPAKNPRVLIIQKVYGQVINNEQKIKFEKHRFKKFIKDVVLGTIERSEIINDQIKNIETNFNLKNLDDIFKIIIRCATFEFLYKPSLSKKIIIKEYLNVSNFFLSNSQTKYLNAILDNLAKNLKK
ncbi:antitermination protein [Candidatus Pelagibacter sp.]|nr:antitermination protein [Candidatus Pelagibacter sp.]|tara:strand:- start:146 stop:538 length:393 start_codon:yes stop_codon:yes gene_type:complete